MTAPEPEELFYAIDSLSVAYHEIGHATAQWVLGVGPESIKLTFKEGAWTGQSLPMADGHSDAKRARTYVTQLAGPIAQIVYRKESLRQHAKIFSKELLQPSLELGINMLPVLDSLRWGFDLLKGGKIILAARTTENTKGAKAFRALGSYLFPAEQALFSFFRDVTVTAFVSEMAIELDNTHEITGRHFASLANAKIFEPEKAPLLSIDLDFTPSH